MGEEADLFIKDGINQLIFPVMEDNSVTVIDITDRYDTTFYEISNFRKIEAEMQFEIINIEPSHDESEMHMKEDEEKVCIDPPRAFKDMKIFMVEARNLEPLQVANFSLSDYVKRKLS
jgi:hypothetical protein